MWTGMMNRLGVKLLFSTTYHPQTDGQSERTNQTVEIALRYMLIGDNSLQTWTRVIPRLTMALNNSVLSSTRKSPTQILYRTKVREPIDLITGLPAPSRTVADRLELN